MIIIISDKLKTRLNVMKYEAIHILIRFEKNYIFGGSLCKTLQTARPIAHDLMFVLPELSLLFPTLS